MAASTASPCGSRSSSGTSTKPGFRGRRRRARARCAPTPTFERTMSTQHARAASAAATCSAPAAAAAAAAVGRWPRRAPAASTAPSTQVPGRRASLFSSSHITSTCRPSTGGSRSTRASSCSSRRDLWRPRLPPASTSTTRMYTSARAASAPSLEVRHHGARRRVSTRPAATSSATGATSITRSRGVRRAVHGPEQPQPDARERDDAGEPRGEHGDAERQTGPAASRRPAAGVDRRRQQRELGDETRQRRQAGHQQHAADEAEAEERHRRRNRDADLLVGAVRVRLAHAERE